MYDLILRNGRIVDGSGLPWYRADIAVLGDRIAAIGHFPKAFGTTEIDATGLVVSPGFIDAHVHGDLPLLVDPFHEPSVRQGVTTHVIGQDGVAFAPGSETTQQYMRRYTAGFNGNFPTPGRSWTTIAEFLRQFDNRCAINACTLIPNGNVRMDVMGLESRAPTADEMAQMKAMIRQGMEEGAVGISSGLDYIPSIYADVHELTAICEEITPYGGIYVTHMRGYNPVKAPAALEEVFAIGRDSGCGVHVSHFNCIADQTIPMLDAARASGVDVTFDLYPYLYGSTIVGMLTLPPELYEGGIEPTLERLKNPEVRASLQEAFANPRFPIETIRLANLPHPEWKKYEGKLLVEAAKNTNLLDFVCDMLIATELAAGCVIRHFAERQESDILKLMRHPVMMAGSDGIYTGGFPHPRGTGTFAKYMGDDVRAGIWSIEEAVMKCSHHAARRYGLGDRGLLKPGFAADIAVFDPQEFQAASTYENGRALAVGMRHVIVNGELVLCDGERMETLPGRGLKKK
jgi:N-acyl-D-amino-acid deacylase